MEQRFVKKSKEDNIMNLKANLEKNYLDIIDSLIESRFNGSFTGNVTRGYALARIIEEIDSAELISAAKKTPPRESGGSQICWRIKADALDVIDDVAREAESTRTAVVKAALTIAAEKYGIHSDNDTDAKPSADMLSIYSPDGAPNMIAKFMEQHTNEDCPLWKYNFEDECGDSRYKELPVFKKYFTFKTSPKAAGDEFIYAKQYLRDHFGFTPIADPDGSGAVFYPIVHEIYNKLWGWHKKDKTTFGFMGGKHFGNILWGADTLNSVQISLGWLAGSEYSSTYFTLNAWLRDKRVFENRMRKLSLDRYISVYHTLGNFALVPAAFNRDRAGVIKDGELHDFFDRSLAYLKETGYYKFEKEKFPYYINFFFFWDYVESVKTEYTVKDLSSGLIFGAEPVKFKTFFETASEFIERRGKFMTAMLMISQRSESNYAALQNEIFDTNTIYGGFEDVVREIERLISLQTEEKDILEELL